MKEFLIVAISFLLFLLLRIVRNRLNSTQKLIISFIFIGVLSFGIISRSLKHFNSAGLVILVVFIILFSWRLLNHLKG